MVFLEALQLNNSIKLVINYNIIEVNYFISFLSKTTCYKCEIIMPKFCLTRQLFTFLVTVLWFTYYQITVQPQDQNKIR